MSTLLCSGPQVGGIALQVVDAYYGEVMALVKAASGARGSSVYRFIGVLQQESQQESRQRPFCGSMRTSPMLSHGRSPFRQTVDIPEQTVDE